MVLSGAVAPQKSKRSSSLFTKLLERVHLNTIESYNGEKVQYLNERAKNSGAQVDTKITRLSEFGAEAIEYDLTAEYLSEAVKRTSR